MWSSFFDALGTMTAWGMYIMLCVIAFIFIKAVLTGLWILAKTLL